MPFPPAFDHNWDLTQPPDTQLANQGALDFRNLKDDIMQRMSLLSGTLANRPTPEVVNATWGGAGFGLLFFATDTGQAFQWNGAAWVDVSNSVGGSRRFTDTTLFNYVAPNANQVGNSINIPQGLLRVGSIIEFETVVVISGVPMTDTASVNFGLGGSTAILSMQGSLFSVLFRGMITFTSNTAFIGTGFEFAIQNPNGGATILSNACPNITANPFNIQTSLTANAGPNTGTYTFNFLGAVVTP